MTTLAGPGATLVCLHRRLDWVEAVARNHADWRAVVHGGPCRIRLFEPARPVLSLGRRATTRPDRATAATIALASARGLAIVDDDRGGLATLHLPGQLVALIAMPIERAAIAAFVGGALSRIASVCVAAGMPDVEVVTDGPDVGLWYRSAKLVSVGLRHADGVVRHGFAVNVAVVDDLASGLLLCGRPTRELANLSDGGARRSVHSIAVDVAAALVSARGIGHSDSAPPR